MAWTKVREVDEWWRTARTSQTILFGSMSEEEAFV